MKSNTKSSVTLPQAEAREVEKLRKSLGAKSNVEVVRRGLKLLREQTDREHLRLSYQEASTRARETLSLELEELDHLSDEGLS